jgi:serine/threonine protein kinase
MGGRTLSYDTDGLLGKGGYGQVYHGTLTGEKHPAEVKVAIKVLKTAKKLFPHKTAAFQKGLDKELRKKAEQEAKIQGLFDSNAHYLSDGIDGTRTYLISTYEENSCDLWSENFKNWLKGKPLGERLTLVIALLTKVQEMHAQGVIHLDLKEENVLAQIGDTVAETTFRIIDFGFSVQLPERQTEISLPNRCGTESYVAPEVMETKLVSPKTDIYSITPVVLSLLGVQNPLRLKYARGTARVRPWFWRLGYAVDMADIPLPDSLRQTPLSAALAYFLYRMHRLARDERPSALECVTFFTQYSALLKEVKSPSAPAEPIRGMLDNKAYEAVSSATAQAQKAHTAALEKANGALANGNLVAARTAAAKAGVYAASVAEKQAVQARAIAEAKAYQELKGKLDIMTAMTVLTLGFSGLDCWAVFSAHPYLLAHKIASIAGSATLGLALLPLLSYVAQCPKATSAGAVASFTVAAVLLTLSAVYEHGGLSFIKSLPLPLVFAQAGAALLVLAGMALHYTCTSPAPMAAAQLKLFDASHR